jgi:hypothetical protein
MEETNTSTAAAEGDGTDQKLPATPTRSSKGSAREKSERDAKRKAGRSEYGSSIPGAQALNDTDQKPRSSKGLAREMSERDAKRKAGRSGYGSSIPGAQALNDTDQKPRSSRGLAREKSERDA